MRIRIGRIVILAIAMEALAIGILVALVACFGPRDRATTQAYAEHLGQFVGPIATAVLCFFGAWWLVRRMKSGQILNGFVLGATSAAVDLASLVPFGGKFQLLIAVSMAGRMIAGTLGGWVARWLALRKS